MNNETLTISVDVRTLRIGDVYAFRHAGLNWRRVVRVRQVTIKAAGRVWPVTEIMHGRTDRPGMLTIVNVPHGGKVEIAA